MVAAIASPSPSPTPTPTDSAKSCGVVKGFSNLFGFVTFNSAPGPIKVIVGLATLALFAAPFVIQSPPYHFVSDAFFTQCIAFSVIVSSYTLNAGIKLYEYLSPQLPAITESDRETPNTCDIRKGFSNLVSFAKYSVGTVAIMFAWISLYAALPF